MSRGCRAPGQARTAPQKSGENPASIRSERISHVGPPDPQGQTRPPTPGTPFTALYHVPPAASVRAGPRSPAAGTAPATHGVPERVLTQSQPHPGPPPGRGPRERFCRALSSLFCTEGICCYPCFQLEGDSSDRFRAHVLPRDSALGNHRVPSTKPWCSRRGSRGDAGSGDGSGRGPPRLWGGLDRALRSRWAGADGCPGC